MKNFVSKLMLLAAVAVGPMAMADNVLYIDPIFQVANSGSTVSLGVRIDSATNISGFQFDLTYNPIFASLVSQTGGPIFGNFIAGFDDTLGTISTVADLLIGPGGISTTDGLLASFQFMMAGPGLANFNIANVIILDELGLPVVTGDPVGGSVQVNGPSVVPEPSTYLLSAGALLGLLALRRKNA